MMLGYAMCGSFCTMERSIEQMKRLRALGYEIQPFMSEILYETDTRFGQAERFRKTVETICQHKIVHTIPMAEPYGPGKGLDLLVISPCTGNTLAKLACGITDTTVCMIAKAHLRNDRPVLIALATNDALSANLANIGTLQSRKNLYFVPLLQDDPEKKPHSLVADFDLLPNSVEAVLNGKRIGKLFG